MTSIKDVAQYILDELKDDEFMNCSKLQRLCYYSQAWHYTWTGKIIFPENFEAWKTGAVCQLLYDCYQHNTRIGNPDNVDDDAKDSIDVVLKAYGYRDHINLGEMQRAEDPWINARKDVPRDKNSTNIVTVESMGEFYRRMMKGELEDD